MKKFCLYLLFLLLSLSCHWYVPDNNHVINHYVDTDKTIIFNSSDKELNTVFEWAKTQAIKYVGDSNDPVGPWYEAALPAREAFCMRDVSHQSIGAEILGLGTQNLNMFLKFAKNISDAKDWCTYWEINRYNQPAPVDYANDKEFWYNLPANFDMVGACWRLYKWTGNENYINDQDFLNFYEKTFNEYIESWQLQADKIMDRPQFMNSPSPFNANNPFHSCRGLPSYVESFQEMTCSADLLASIYYGLNAYSNILKENKQNTIATETIKKAEEYRELFDSKWWNSSEKAYETFLTIQQEFAKGEGETFILWFDIAQQKERIVACINNLQNGTWNVENRSYFPVLFSKYGYLNEAYDEIISLSSPATPRREYPEVSFGVIEGIVSGIMGIEVFAPENQITSCPNLISSVEWTDLKNLKVMETKIDVKHQGKTKTTLCNNGTADVNWKAKFPGQHSSIIVNGKEKTASPETDCIGNYFSFITVNVKAGEKASAEI